MGLFNRDSADDVSKLSQVHAAVADRLDSEFQSGLAILRRVRERALAEAEAAEAKGKLLIEHAKTLADKFTEK